MNLRHWLRILGLSFAALLLLLISTILFISNHQLESLLIKSLQLQGYSCKVGSLSKVLPLGIRIRDLSLADERGPLLKVDQATIRLRLLQLILGRVAVSARAEIGKGSIVSELNLQRDGDGEVTITGLQLEDLPLIPTITGSQAKGVVQSRGSWRQNNKQLSGSLQLEVKDAELRAIKIGGTPLPDAAYRTVQGSLALAGNKINLASLTFDGAGLYVRLKGDMPLLSPLAAAPLNLTVEMMPQPDFLEKQKFVFLLLLKYQTTPGRYEIPIRGTLAKPALP